MALTALKHERAQRMIAEQQLKLLLPLTTATAAAAPLLSSSSPVPTSQCLPINLSVTKHNSNEGTIHENIKTGNSDKNDAMMLDAVTLQVLSKQIVQCHL